MLKSYYKKPVILLIDEYDVPIAKASSNGYYKEMLEIMKGLLSTALKDNSSLKFFSHHRMPKDCQRKYFHWNK